MVEVLGLMVRELDMRAIADDVARALSSARVRGPSGFVSTAVRYPNGTAAVVRIDQDVGGFFVSDDGHSALSAEMMGALSTFSRVAPSVAERSSVKFDRRTFFLSAVPREGLPIAVAYVANASARASEKTLYALEHLKIKRSRDVFNNRLIEAFGDRVAFDVPVIGSTGREWDYEAAVYEEKRIVKLFTLVSPAFTAIAAANLKISDTRTLAEAPQITAALTDYDRTEPALRSLLSASADLVIAANDDADHYRLTA